MDDSEDDVEEDILIESDDEEAESPTHLAHGDSTANALLLVAAKAGTVEESDAALGNVSPPLPQPASLSPAPWAQDKTEASLLSQQGKQSGLAGEVNLTQAQEVASSRSPSPSASSPTRSRGDPEERRRRLYDKVADLDTSERSLSAVHGLDLPRSSRSPPRNRSPARTEDHEHRWQSDENKHPRRESDEDEHGTRFSFANDMTQKLEKMSENPSVAYRREANRTRDCQISDKLPESHAERNGSKGSPGGRLGRHASPQGERLGSKGSHHLGAADRFQVKVNGSSTRQLGIDSYEMLTTELEELPVEATKIQAGARGYTQTEPQRHLSQQPLGASSATRVLTDLSEFTEKDTEFTEKDTDEAPTSQKRASRESIGSASRQASANDLSSFTVEEPEKITKVQASTRPGRQKYGMPSSGENTNLIDQFLLKDAPQKQNASLIDQFLSKDTPQVQTAGLIDQFLSKDTPQVLNANPIDQFLSKDAPQVQTTRLIDNFPSKDAPQVQNASLIDRPLSMDTPQVQNTSPIEQVLSKDAAQAQNTSPIDQFLSKDAPQEKNMNPVDHFPSKDAPQVQNTSLVDQSLSKDTPQEHNTSLIDRSLSKEAPQEHNTSPIDQLLSKDAPQVQNTSLIGHVPSKPAPRRPRPQVQNTSLVDQFLFKDTPQEPSANLIDQFLLKDAPRKQNSSLVDQSLSKDAPQEQSTSLIDQSLSKDTPQEHNTSPIDQFLSKDAPQVQNAPPVDHFPSKTAPQVQNTSLVDQFLSKDTPQEPNANLIDQFLLQDAPRKQNASLVDQFLSKDAPQEQNTSLIDQSLSKNTPQVQNTSPIDQFLSKDAAQVQNTRPIDQFLSKEDSGKRLDLTRFTVEDAAKITKIQAGTRGLLARKRTSAMPMESEKQESSVGQRRRSSGSLRRSGEGPKAQRRLSNYTEEDAERIKKIQANARGMLVRKQMHQKSKIASVGVDEYTDADIARLTKLQANARGHLARKHIAEENRAVLKIQSITRGRIARKEASLMRSGVELQATDAFSLTALPQKQPCEEVSLVPVKPPGRPSFGRRMLRVKAPPKPEDVLSEEALIRRAEKKLAMMMHSTRKNLVSFNPRPPSPAPRFALEKLSSRARDAMLRTARIEAEAWLNDAIMQAESQKRFLEVETKLGEWHQQREAARQAEEARLRALEEEKEKLVVVDHRKWKRRGERLRDQVAQWGAQKAIREEKEGRDNASAAEAEKKIKAEKHQKHRKRLKEQLSQWYHSKSSPPLDDIPKSSPALDNTRDKDSLNKTLPPRGKAGGEVDRKKRRKNNAEEDPVQENEDTVIWFNPCIDFEDEKSITDAALKLVYGSATRVATESQARNEAWA